MVKQGRRSDNFVCAAINQKTEIAEMAVRVTNDGIE